jgi:membrane protein insertase Oxa1/YidC/SpoIIIJ
MEYAYTWSDFVGNVGVALLIGTFAMLQFDKINPKGFWYSFNNLMVALLLLVNLYFKPNLSSIIIEIFWILLSIYGLVNYYKSRSKSKNEG